MSRQAPTPSHVLRIHSTQVNAIAFSDDNERIYSGGLSGEVVVTSTRTLRSIAAWQAHTDGILGVREWKDNIITYLRSFARFDQQADDVYTYWVVAQATVGDTAVRTALAIPELRYSLDVNAFNFCSFSLLPLDQSHFSAHSSSSSSIEYSEQALIAVPNLVESSLADIWDLPSCKRLHAAIGKLETPNTGRGLELEGRGGSGVLMSLHVFQKPTSSGPQTLHLLSAYESGEVMLRRYTDLSRDISIEGRGWELLWKCKEHVESVMALSVSHDHSFALSTSADNFIVKYTLADCIARDESGAEDDRVPTTPRSVKYRIKQFGNGAIALRDDDRICALGGWDGKIRLYSTKSFKPLGSLSYHSKNCQAVAFAHSISLETKETSGTTEDDEMTGEEKESRSRWLVAGSHDRRLSVWELFDFEKLGQH